MASPLDALGRLLAIQMEGKFGLTWMLSRYDVILSGLDRLSTAGTDKRRSIVHRLFILTKR